MDVPLVLGHALLIPVDTLFLLFQMRELEEILRQFAAAARNDNFGAYVWYNWTPGRYVHFYLVDHGVYYVMAGDVFNEADAWWNRDGGSQARCTHPCSPLAMSPQSPDGPPPDQPPMSPHSPEGPPPSIMG